MSSPTVLVTDFEFRNLDLEQGILNRHGIDVVTMQAENSSEIAATDTDPDALLVQYAQITDEVFEALPNLRVVGVYGIGVDNIDLDSANRHDVAIVNVPTYCEDEVAEHTLGLLMACERKISMLDNQVKDGDWDWKAARPVRRIGGRTLGLVGFGKIGRTVVEKTTGLDFDVITSDPNLDEGDVADIDVELVPFEELLEESDIISVHAPLNDATRGLFDESRFEKMNSDAVFLNVARGPVIDIAALLSALEEGEIRAAGLDVLPSEPPSSKETQLFEFDNVVLSPHCAWYSEQSTEDLRETVTKDIIGILTGSDPKNPVK